MPKWIAQLRQDRVQWPEAPAGLLGRESPSVALGAVACVSCFAFDRA